MANYRVSYHFFLGKRHFDYQFYAAGSLDSVFAAATRQPLLDAFGDMHSNATYCDSISVANVNGERRDWDLRPVDIRGKAKLAPAGTSLATEPDVTNTSMLIRLRTSEGEGRYLTLSGIPDVIVERLPSGDYNVPSQWKEELPNKLVAELKNSAFCIRAKEAVPLTDASFVKTISPDPDTQNRFTVLSFRGIANPFDVGEEVEFVFNRRNLPLLPYRGIFKVVEAGAYSAGPPVVLPYIVIEAQYAAVTDPYTPGRFYIKPVVYSYPPIDGGNYVKINTRKRGGTQQPKGRVSGISYREP